MVRKYKTAEEKLDDLMILVKEQFEIQEELLEKTAEDVRDLREGQLLHDKRFDELESAVRGISRAIDKDSVKVIDHERRIKRLEYKSMR